MSFNEIERKKTTLENEYNNIHTTMERKKEIEIIYNELTSREIINDYLYYGYGLKTFIDNDYECAKNINYDRLKQLFEEQRNYLGNCD